MLNLPYKIEYLIGLLLLILIVFIVSAQKRSFAEITGSPHDFSKIGYAHGDGEICKVCHIPHNAGSKSVPLWRGSLAVTYLNMYKPYSSDTMNATISSISFPSKACLTCHDGAIAKGPVSGCQSCHYRVSSTDYNLGNDHPISFTYDTALAQKDGALQDPASTPVVSLGGKTIQQGMLYQERLECPSCHDVHATKGDSATAPHLLLVDNKNDKLCLTCHNK